MLCSLCGQLESLGYRHQLLAQPQMNVSLNITTFTQPMRIAPRLSLKQAQRSQPQSEVAQLSRSHSMCFSERLICVRLWFFCLSLAILGLSHLSAAAACLSPDPYAVNSNISVNLRQDSGCTLGSFTVGAGITLSSPSGSPIIDNDGTITTITNNGIISGAELISNAIAGSVITTIVNRGTMSSTIAAIRNQGGVISLINNSGAISSNEQTVRNTGAILDLINTGTIVGTSAGIDNSGVITTLHNQQGSSGGSPLTYSGILPTKYRILIAGTTTFGRLSAGSVTGVTEFGVSRFSTISTSILNTTFADVLVGITPANLGLGSATTISDVSNGYSYRLTQTNLLTNSWSLIITACRDCQISSGTSVGLSSLGANSVLSGGTLVLLSGDSSSTAFSVTSESTIQKPNSGSATLSGVFSGAGGLTFTGAGTTILTGANTYSGGTIVSSGTLQGNTTSLQGAIVNNSQVVFDQATDGTYAGAMSGSGSLTKQNAGTLILTGANTYSGGTIVSSGTLQGNTTSLQGSITSNGKVVFDQLSTGTFSGTIAGLGAVVVQNSGTVVLSGANTYSGGTTVFGGTLSLAGTAPTGRGDVVISSAGTLMGTGTIAGNVLVSGVLKPGNSPGYLSFAQNLTLNSGSTYQQDIAGATQASSATPVGASGYYSFVSVGRQLTITSGAALTPRLANLFSASETGYRSSIYVPVLGDKFRIITAGGITGRFTTLTQPAELSNGTQLIVFYNVNSSNSVDLATVPNSYNTTLNSGTTNAKSVAGVLDQLLGVNKAGTASSTQDSLLYALAGQNAASLPDFARSLAGEVHAASAATLPQTTRRVQQSVLSRLGDYPMVPSQLNLAVNQNTVNVTSAAVKDGCAWGEITYQRTERASNHTGHGYNSNLNQIVTGVDAYSNVELGLKLGGGISLSNTTVSANGGNSTIQQGSVFVYGKMPVLQDYVLDGMASVGLSSTNVSRNDPTAYTGGFRNKGGKGNDAMVSVGLSRAFDYSDVRITPYARLSYQYVGQAAYDEGSGAAALNITGFNGGAVRGVIGLAAGSSNKDPLKYEYTYRANTAVGTDSSGLLNPTLGTTLGSYSSSVTTATAGSAFVQVGFYGTVKISDNAYAYAGVSGEARTGQTLYGGNVGLRMAF